MPVGISTPTETMAVAASQAEAMPDERNHHLDQNKAGPHAHQAFPESRDLCRVQTLIITVTNFCP